MKKVDEIVFVTMTMGAGGSERVIATLSNHFAARGVKVTILQIGGDRVEYDIHKDVSVKSLSGKTSGSIKGRLSRITALREEIKKHGKAGVIAMGSVASMFVIVSTIGLSNKKVVTERNDPNQLNHRPIRIYEKMARNILFGMSDRVVLQTESAKNAFPSYIKKKSTIIMNPLSHEYVDDCNSSNKRKCIVMTAGRLTEQKNHHMLIDAFIRFHERHDSYVLNIFGDGELKGILQDYINKKQAEEYIYLRGQTNDIKGELSKSQIYVSSSNWEGISNALLEALAMGCATVATDCPVGGSAMLIDDGKNGIIIPVGDVDSLCCALTKLADDEEYRESISQVAKRVIETANVDVIADKWLGCL